MTPCCDMCGREKLPSDKPYDALALVTGGACGWFRNSEGENVCEACMTKLFKRANNL